MYLKPVGFVSSDVRDIPPRDFPWREHVSKITINPEYSGSLSGLEGFSHIIVIWWQHRVDFSRKLTDTLHPRGDESLPLTGRFATRSPHRPNPLGLAIVRLLSVEGNILAVQGLDAIDGSPVLDIKPYIPGSDTVKDATTPAWIKRT